MALQKTVTTPHGLTATNAYHRVEGLSLISKTRIVFSVRSYADPSNAAFSEVACECDYDLAGDNPIAQAYAYAKTLAQFDGATDV